jgi:hypothetical protein
VLFPSAGPESFSYTLTEAWATGRPALVPPIGALAERVRSKGGGFIMTEREWRDEEAMLDRIVSVLGARDELATASVQAQALRGATRDEMATATFALYERTLALAGDKTARMLKPLEPARLRYGLGYVPWVPPAPEVPWGQARAKGLLQRIARAAANRRHTAAGRLLFRLAPVSVVAALRARLK